MFVNAAITAPPTGIGVSEGKGRKGKRGRERCSGRYRSADLLLLFAAEQTPRPDRC